VNRTIKILDFLKNKTSCGDCNLAELCLPRGLEKEELSRLDSIVKRSRPLQRGDHLFRAGDMFVSIFAVRSGAIKLYAFSEQSEEQILGFYLPGEILGLDAIHAERHMGYAIALETSSYCAIPFNHLEETCKEIPGLQHQLYKIMSRELSQENELLLTLSNKDAEEKVASFLVNLSARYRQLGYSSLEFRLPMTRKDIGVYLGLTVETISRIFGRLQQYGVITTDRKFIQILKPDVLRGICIGHDSGRQQQDSVA